ncbi:MAG: GAF domain-containing protein, partial [Anaerolineales bacterium]|nr:GAF domain-containing protein [Anaerolineales bacterium]
MKTILKSIGWELNAIDFPYDPGVNPIRDQLRAGIPYIGHSISDLLCPPLPRRLIDLAVRIYGIQTVLDVPLVVDDEVVGFLLILSRQADITPEDQRAVEIVARQAATAIERARYLQRLHKRTDELAKSVERLENVRALGEDIAQAKYIDDKLNILVQGVVEHLDFNSAHIRLHDQYTSLSTRSAIYPFN